MNVKEFDLEYMNLNLARKKDFLRRVFNTIVENIDNEDFDTMVGEWLLPVLIDFEAEDGFGTEGFRG